jgi:hypothetical protein
LFGEAYQRAFHIVKQALPANRRSIHSSNEHIVSAGQSVKRQKFVRRFAKAAFRPASHNSVSDLLCRGETGAELVRVFAAAGLHDD